MDDLDHETAALILQLEIEDSTALSDNINKKGKGREGEVADTQIALQLYKEDLQRYNMFLSDQLMTKSIALACQSDGELLNSSVAQERMFLRDRQLAFRLSGRSVNLENARPSTHNIKILNDDQLSKLSAEYVGTNLSRDNVSVPQAGQNQSSKNPDTTDAVGESSTWAASRKHPDKRIRQCIACGDSVELHNTARLACEHDYCRECLQGLFRSSHKDESLFPPRCCRQIITIDQIRRLLTPELISQHEAKTIEYETKDRTYCSNPACSVFITKEHIEHDIATCGACKKTTCTLCKTGSHLGDCPSDSALQLVLRTAEEEGWQRCSGCRLVVELIHGCYHITCLCGKQFCYVCAAPWKTCDCPQWHIDRLLIRARRIAARDQPNLNEEVQADRVAQGVTNLIDRHDCPHYELEPRFRKDEECELCGFTMPLFIYECQRCRFLVCKRCKLNRL